jgi:hypothetical protein
MSNIMVPTSTSAIVRGYPWSNGIALAENRKDVMQKALEGTSHPAELVKMAMVS